VARHETAKKDQAKRSRNDQFREQAQRIIPQQQPCERML
jgi:hypothetical protein